MERTGFAAIFGERRGISDSERTERERLARDSTKPFVDASPDGHTVITIYYLCNDEDAGIVHRENGPAWVGASADGHVLEFYYREGQLQRENGPAFVESWPDGRRSEMHYRKDEFTYGVSALAH
jgi:hypothetical protein